jgi:uncharacterized cupredoxin-like copper-binding protein
MYRPLAAARPLIVLGAAALAAAAAGGGCGGETARARGGALTVSAREYADLPRRLEAPAGRLTIALRNTGVLDHDLVVRRGSATVARLSPVAPGATGRLRVRLAPGTYELACTEWRHGQLGEHAALRVR